MIVNEEIIKDFVRLQKDMKSFFEVSGRVTQKYVFNELGITAPTWRKKLREQEFTGNEMMKIAKILNNIKV